MSPEDIGRLAEAETRADAGRHQGDRLHDFVEDLCVELRFQPMFDDHLTALGYTLRDATEAEQWRGIDRVAMGTDGVEVLLECKVDTVGQRTGRAFIETISNDRSGRPGWALTTEATFVLYLVVGRALYWLPPGAVRDALPGWQAQFPTKAADNGEYRTLGVCVPLEVLEALASRVEAPPAPAAEVPPWPDRVQWGRSRFGPHLPSGAGEQGGRGP